MRLLQVWREARGGTHTHLRRVLKSYADYYNRVRTHQSLNRDAPVSRPVRRSGLITSHAILADFTLNIPEFKVFGTHTRTFSSKGDAGSLRLGVMI
jgi:hypothetical protein